MSNIFTKFLRSNSKKVLVISAFLVAVASAISLGLATKQLTSATVARDCSQNSIDKANINGGCGALSPSELIADIKDNNPSDLQSIYNAFGLSSADYNRFRDSAKMGTAYRDGRVVVDGQTVMTDAWSIGRDKQSYSWNKSIGGKTYYASYHKDVYGPGVNSIPVMVMFNDDGSVEAAILTACGNPVDGKKVIPEFKCKSLTATPVKNEKNTYMFKTDAPASKGAKVTKAEYEIVGAGTTDKVTRNDLSEVKYKFAKPGTYDITVTVTFSLPGGKTMTKKCTTRVTIKEEPKPYYACTAVIPTTLNDEKTKFRFTVKTSQGNGAVLTDADFTLNGATVTGVTTKDQKGNIYKEYEIARDGKEYTVTVKVNFNIGKEVQSKTCVAKVTSGKTPMCVVDGKEYPFGSPECEPYKCPIEGKEDLPKEQCVETPAELPKTGMGNVLGIFAGTSAIGAIGHRVFMNRRRNG